MKLAKHFDSLRADILAIAQAYGVDIATSDGGQTGLKTMYALHDIVCKNRAYDDSHPGFSGGHWKRVLPYDGRPYCFLYEGGCDDSHVATLLRRIKASICATAKA